jgi:hypothetical protein
LKAKWDAIDVEVKQEVTRREREVTKVLNDSATARQTLGTLQQTVAPYQQRLQAMGADPIRAVGELLKADYLLATGPKRARAELIAKFIKDYDVDIAELDNVLSGQAPVNPVDSRVEQLLQQRLAPFQQFLTQQQQNAQQQKVQEEQRMQATIAEMSTSPEFPHFDSVRDTMADLIEINTRKGITLSLKECYNKAVAMDPHVSAELAAKAGHDNVAKLVAERNAKAQRAKHASSSISGAPVGARAVTPPASDRRATLAAAYDTLEGR